MKYRKGKKIETLQKFVEIYMKSQPVFVGEAIVESYKSKNLSLDYVEKCINKGLLFEAIEDKPAEFWVNEYDKDIPIISDNIGCRFISEKRYNSLEEAKAEAYYGCIGQVKFREVTSESN